METLQIYGVEFLVTLQSITLPALEWPMRLVTFFGEEMFYMIAGTFIYWCLSRELGVRLLIVLLLTNMVNLMGKWALHSPRPYWFDPDVRGLVGETSYGPPSGHSQVPMSTWTYAAAYLARRGVAYVWPVALFIVFLIGFSRMVLGVHFPHALIFGWVLGALVAFVCWKLTARAGEFFFGGREARRWAVALVAPALALAVMVTAHFVFLSGVDPLRWAANAAVSQPDHTIDPHSWKSAISSAGALAGVLVAAILITRTGTVGVSGPWPRRIARFGLGFGVLIAIQIGLSALFPKGEDVVALAFRFLRYFTILLWAMWLAPLVFARVGLAEYETDA